MSARYFGPANRRKEDEVQVDTPVGETCMVCQEAIAEGDMGTINHFNQISHYECGMRMIIGSVGHQLGRCHCFGGTQEDPEGMTARQGAIAATRLWESRALAPRYRVLRHTRVRAFECLDCGAVSYSTSDLENRYCGRCNKFHEPRKLYEGRLVVSLERRAGIDAADGPCHVPANARGYIVTIMPGIADKAYAVLFPAHGQAVVMASMGELTDSNEYQLLED